MSTDAVRAALAELVALKDLKDRLDLAEMLGPMLFESMEDWREASREYMRRKPLAWAAAQAALSEPAPSVGVPEGYRLVPIDVLRDASNALGNFVSDHGWAQQDMDAMDTLYSYIAVAEGE